MNPVPTRPLADELAPSKPVSTNIKLAIRYILLVVMNNGGAGGIATRGQIYIYIYIYIYRRPYWCSRNTFASEMVPPPRPPPPPPFATPLVMVSKERMSHCLLLWSYRRQFIRTLKYQLFLSVLELSSTPNKISLRERFKLPR